MLTVMVKEQSYSLSFQIQISQGFLKVFFMIYIMDSAYTIQ